MVLLFVLSVRTGTRALPVDIRNSRNMYNLLMKPALGAMHNHKSIGTLKTHLLRKGLVRMCQKQKSLKRKDATSHVLIEMQEKNIEGCL